MQVGGPANPEVLQRLSAAVLALEPWALDVEAAAQIVKVYFFFFQLPRGCPPPLYTRGSGLLVFVFAKAVFAVQACGVPPRSLH